jgi:hypothetical protein
MKYNNNVPIFHSALFYCIPSIQTEPKESVWFGEGEGRD